jgi:hypothetical protein
MRLLESYSTEFYVSDSGYLVIKQEHMECGYEASFLLTPEQTKALYKLLPNFIQEQTENWTGIDNPAEE